MDCQYFDKNKSLWEKVQVKADEDLCGLQMGNFFVNIYSTSVFKLKASQEDLPSCSFKYHAHIQNEIPLENGEFNVECEDFCLDGPKRLPEFKNLVNSLINYAEDKQILPTVAEEKVKLVIGDFNDSPEIETLNTPIKSEEEVEVVESFSTSSPNNAKEEIEIPSESKIDPVIGSSPHNVEPAKFAIEVSTGKRKFSVPILVSEINKMTVEELKARISLILLAENSQVKITSTKQMRLMLGAVEVQDTWILSDFGIHPFICLSVEIRTERSDASIPKRSLRPLFVLDVDGKSLEIFSGDVPEQVAKEFIMKNALEFSSLNFIVLQIYRGLTKTFQREIKLLEHEVHQLTKPAVEPERNVHEILLTEAAKQIQMLQSDRARLNQKVLELNMRVAGLAM